MGNLAPSPDEEEPRVPDDDLDKLFSDYEERIDAESEEEDGSDAIRTAGLSSSPIGPTPLRYRHLTLSLVGYSSTDAKHGYGDTVRGMWATY
jgi:hypothetical protein